MKFQHKTFYVGIKTDRALTESDPFFMHYFKGQHARYHGRPYRRGKNRCLWCGAPLDAPDDPNWMSKQVAASFNSAFI